MESWRRCSRWLRSCRSPSGVRRGVPARSEWRRDGWDSGCSGRLLRSRSWRLAWRSSFAACPMTTTTPSRTRWCSCWSESARRPCGGRSPPCRSPVPCPGASPGRLLAVVGVGALVAWAGTHIPPPVHADGGYPAARVAADRIETMAGPGAIDLRSLPVFKSIEAYAYPLVVGGRELERGEDIGTATLVREDADPSAPTSIVVICDRAVRGRDRRDVRWGGRGDPGAVRVGRAARPVRRELRAG